MTTLADYQDTSTGWPSESTIDRGNTVGASDNGADWKAISWGSGLNPLGVNGKGLIK
jgi:hypothetical protein